MRKTASVALWDAVILLFFEALKINQGNPRTAINLAVNEILNVLFLIGILVYFIV